MLISQYHVAIQIQSKTPGYTSSRTRPIRSRVKDRAQGKLSQPSQPSDNMMDSLGRCDKGTLYMTKRSETERGEVKKIRGEGKTGEESERARE